MRGGTEGANDALPRLAGDLFATDDLQVALRTFLGEGHGRARFTGR